MKRALLAAPCLTGLSCADNSFSVSGTFTTTAWGCPGTGQTAFPQSCALLVQASSSTGAMTSPHSLQDNATHLLVRDENGNVIEHTLYLNQFDFNKP